MALTALTILLHRGTGPASGVLLIATLPAKQLLEAGPVQQRGLLGVSVGGREVVQGIKQQLVCEVYVSGCGKYR